MSLLSYGDSLIVFFSRVFSRTLVPGVDSAILQMRFYICLAFIFFAHAKLPIAFKKHTIKSKQTGYFKCNMLTDFS